MSSIHLEAEIGQIAETVLLPGDPLRAKYMAEHMLEDVICYNKVRNMLGYTGYYNGKKVSIQGTGMGMGSMSIYTHELINTYNAKQLIRVGTCGAIQENIKLGDIILAMSASGDSGANSALFGNMHFAATADFGLLLKAYQTAQRLNIKTIQGSIFSTNTFYNYKSDRWNIWEQHGIMAVEMESQILYTLANRFNVKALSILTVSDHIIKGDRSTQGDREKSYTDMFKIALEMAH